MGEGGRASHLNREEGVGGRRWHDKLGGAGAVGGIDQLDGPDEAGLAHVVPPVAVDLRWQAMGGNRAGWDGCSRQHTGQQRDGRSKPGGGCREAAHIETCAQATNHL